MASSNDTIGNKRSREDARSRDAQYPLRHMRNDFAIPTRADLRCKNFNGLLDPAHVSEESHERAIYLCGNSLGLQPKLVRTRIEQYLRTWLTQGVFGHFKPLGDSPLPTWLHADERASAAMAPIVGANASEVAVMETLTANLHLLMAAFYKPDIKARHKIILESKAFPSDHFAIESQILHHGLSTEKSMLTIEPASLYQPTLTTPQILDTISTHASSTAILLLPGIQYYTGQLFDIPTITTAARKAGIFVIWDLAHAVGNVPLYLHEWNVDAAVWCSYKYLNAGPGAIGGMFIHERHTQVSPSTAEKKGWTNRLSGWWGNDKTLRFKMETTGFTPYAGVAGFQLSNPSILDITSLTASLEVFEKAGGVKKLREKSLILTAYLEGLLHQSPFFKQSFWIITPPEMDERGAQLSVRLEDGYLEIVMKALEERGVVVDQRRPDVIRVAPVPLYNGFEDVWLFNQAFDEALEVAQEAKRGEISAEGTRELEMTT